jgi:hypothetical protein
MLTSLRIAVVASLAVTCAALRAAPESSPIGTWRSDDGEAVEEYAFCEDHTYTTWSQSKGLVLHTPGVIIETGVWKRDGNRLRITPKNTNSVGPRRPFSFRIIRLHGDQLVVKQLGRKTTLSFRRLEIPVCAPAQDTLDIATIRTRLIGTWYMHLNTHDYEMTFNQDGTFSATARVEGRSVHVPSGVWRLDANRLTVDLGRENGDSEERGFKWTVIGIESNCVAVKHGSSDLAWRRMR